MDLDSFDSATFERTYQINVMGTLYMFEACLPLLKKSSDAQLVINSSSVAWLPITRAEAYGSSKAALNYIFTAIEPQLKPHGIAVSIICPGFVKTPLTDKNDFPMPCLIDSEKAAAIIRKGIAKKKRIIHFPKRFTWTLRLIGCLPVSIQSWLMRKAVVKREA